jgi:hypothetical protein
MMIIMREDIVNQVDYRGAFGDLRLEKRGERIIEAMQKKETAVINQFSQSRADVVGHSRFFQNDAVSEASLISEASSWAGSVSGDRHVLCIQDTSEFNYQHHKGKLDRADSDLGPVGNDRDIGFFLHPTLVVDAEDGFPLGLGHIEIWNREFGHQKKEERQYSKQPIEEKESYRWISSSHAVQGSLSNASCITIIADREADIYEEFVRVPDSRTHLLIRSLQNRILFDEDDKLFEYVVKQPVSGRYSFEIPCSQNHRQPRQAELEVRYCQVKLSRPKNTVHKESPGFVELFIVEARECSSSVPAGEKPVLWRLLTTHKVLSFRIALQIIQWYRWRWLIEQLFRVLKRQGLDVESSQLETGRGLRKLAIMALRVAVIILQLTCEREGKSGKPATLVFIQDELQCMSDLMPRYEGKTEAQQNPYPKGSLAWAAWLIGRLGGWKGYRKACPAGPITMKRGLERFGLLYTGWVLFQDKRLE